VSRRLIVGTPDKSTGDGQRIPAANLGDLIIRRVRSFIADPAALLNAGPEGRFAAPLQKRLKEAAEDFLRSWENEQSADAVSAFLRNVLVRMRVRADRIDVEVDANRVVEFLLHGLHEDVCTLSLAPESGANSNAADDKLPIVALVIPAELKRTGKELKFIIEGTCVSPPDKSLVRLLSRAYALGQRVRESAGSTLEDIATSEKIVSSCARPVFCG
jgi:hypothetical protein